MNHVVCLSLTNLPAQSIFIDSPSLLAVCLVKCCLRTAEKRKALYLWLLCTGEDGSGLPTMCSSSSRGRLLLLPWWKGMHGCPFLTPNECPSQPMRSRADIARSSQQPLRFNVSHVILSLKFQHGCRLSHVKQPEQKCNKRKESDKCVWVCLQSEVGFYLYLCRLREVFTFGFIACAIWFLKLINSEPVAF